MSKRILELCDNPYELHLDETEYYLEETNQFYVVEARTIYLCHSLVAISKWEAKYKVAFLHNDQITADQFKDYIRMMVVYDPSPSDSDFILSLSNAQLTDIKKYMDDQCTATSIKPQPGHSGGTRYQYITSELVYSWMVGLQIPFDCQYWHFNRLMMLIGAVNEANQPKKKMSQSDAFARQRAANAARRAKYNSKG